MNATRALPESVRVDLDRVVVSAPAASAEIALQGAHVTSWVPAGHRPVLWMSAHSQRGPGLPLRGGVPICFPWFGPAPDGGPLHGLARISGWTLLDAVERDDAVVLTFDLDGSAAWPHPVAAQFRVTVGAELEMRLQVTNVGTTPVTFEEAFHTYLAVADVHDVAIDGLADAPHVDRLDGDRVRPATGEPVRITGETERLYPQPGRIVVRDPAGGRALTIDATGSADAILWNPWTAKSAAMGDFGDDEWTGMVCVETGNVREHAVTLPAGASHTMTATISVSAPAGQVS